MAPYSLLLAAVIAAAAVCNIAAQSCPGAWIPISGPFVEDLGRWAVEQQHATVVPLHFHKVESARFKCTDELRDNYDIILDASSSNSSGAGDTKYRAVVQVIEVIRPEKVLSFDPVAPPPATN